MFKYSKEYYNFVLTRELLRDITDVEQIANSDEFKAAKKKAIESQSLANVINAIRNVPLQTASLSPSNDDASDLGASYARYRNVYASNTVTSNSLVISAPTIPNSPASSGTKGAIAWSNSYIYVCVATNTWVRTAISTWDPNVTVSATTAAVGESFHPYLLSLL
jgi:hypothetical protein